MVEAGIAPYFATKYGLLGFDQIVWADTRHLGLKVTTIAPGLVNTNLGVKKGPVDMLSAREMIQSHDVSSAVDYVVMSRARTCPRRIVLRPMGHPVPAVGNFADRVLKSQARNLGLASGIISARL